MLTESDQTHPSSDTEPGFGTHGCALCAKDKQGRNRIDVPCANGCGNVRAVYRPSEAAKIADRPCRDCYWGAKRDYYVDEMAVVRLIAGTPVNATAHERAAAASELASKGISHRVIAARLHVSRRTVERYQQRQRATV